MIDHHKTPQSKGLQFLIIKGHQSFYAEVKATPSAIILSTVQPACFLGTSICHQGCNQRS